MTTYTDQRLAEDLNSSLPGIRRTAEILVTIAPEARTAVVAEAHYQMNVRGAGWRPSDMLSTVAEAYKLGAKFESAVAQGHDPRTIAAKALADLAAGR